MPFPLIIPAVSLIDPKTGSRRTPPCACGWYGPVCPVVWEWGEPARPPSIPIFRGAFTDLVHTWMHSPLFGQV